MSFSIPGLQNQDCRRKPRLKVLSIPGVLLKGAVGKANSDALTEGVISDLIVGSLTFNAPSETLSTRRPT